MDQRRARHKKKKCCESDKLCNDDSVITKGGNSKEGCKENRLCLERRDKCEKCVPGVEREHNHAVQKARHGKLYDKSKEKNWK